jgi:hypothetical protein
MIRVRTSLDTRWSSLRTRLGRLSCHEGGGLGRATTSLLLRSLQIQSLDRLLNQSVRGNHFLYSRSIMVIHANINCCTYLSCSSWKDTTFQDTFCLVAHAKAPPLLPLAGTTALLLATQCMEPLRGQCGATSG